VKYIIAPLVLLALVGCPKTVKETYDPTTGQLISREEVVDMQTTLALLDAGLSSVERIAELKAEMDGAKGEDKDKLEKKAAREALKAKLAQATAERLLAKSELDPSMKNTLKDVLDAYTTGNTELAKDAVDKLATDAGVTEEKKEAVEQILETHTKPRVAAAAAEEAVENADAAQ
jgi:hypothetical protein